MSGERRAGWVLFACDQCHDVRWVATRDRFSHSGNSCCVCGEWLIPLDEKPDEALPVDEFCNLVKRPSDVILRDGVRNS